MSDEEATDDGSEPSEGTTEIVSEFETRLTEAETSIENAETEPELDSAEALVDDIEADIENAALPDDEEDATNREELEGTVETLREDIEEKRGPYAEDVVAEVQTATQQLTSSEWTDNGIETVSEATVEFIGTVSETLGVTIAYETTDEPERLAENLEEVSEAITDASLDPDDDAETIASLLTATEELSGALENGQVLDDLEIRAQLEYLGFYDVLTPKNKKDFPPEWNAVKLYEARGEVEPLLLALDKLDSDFMQENILDALEHMAPVEAVEDVQALAKRRDVQAVRVLGRIGDERSCSMLEGFLGKGDIKLRKTSLWALGCIGNEGSTEEVAQELDAESYEVRSAAARALGLLGDTRAIDPLADRLESDESESVRASAAWALNQIGTRTALEIVADYADDQSYLVQAEAKKAVV